MDNLSTVDKLPGPNLSFIERFHCIRLSEYGGSIVQYSIYAHNECVSEYCQIIDKVGLWSNYNGSNMCINVIIAYISDPHGGIC